VRYSLSHEPSGDSAGIALFGPEDEVAERLAVLDDQAIEDDLIERWRTATDAREKNGDDLSQIAPNFVRPVLDRRAGRSLESPMHRVRSV
jgi:hypothetical protein